MKIIMIWNCNKYNDNIIIIIIMKIMIIIIIK